MRSLLAVDSSEFHSSASGHDAQGRDQHTGRVRKVLKLSSEFIGFFLARLFFLPRLAPTPRAVPVYGISGRLSPGPLGPFAEGCPALPRHDRCAWNDGADGVLEDQRVNPVCTLQQQRVLIELLQLTGQLDAADQVDRNHPVQHVQHVGQERSL